MRKFLAGYLINGDVEYIRRSNGEYMYFESEDAAKTHLEHEAKVPAYAEDLVIRESTGMYCKQCGAPLFTSDVEGYEYQCFTCDEDFYKFEQE